MMKARISVEVGAVHRKGFREFLNRMKFKYGLEYYETKNLLESEFLIRGNYDLLVKLAKIIKKYGIE